ncbi:MAG TPA: hypothetical protein VL651_15080 [Bacteroidia bacterium]|jgi:hypothetical protein|nr:hypothetical protein [Bacteroidia bacterium]
MILMTVSAQKDSLPVPGEISIDSTGKITIQLHKQTLGEIYLQEYKWNKWVTFDSLRRNAEEDDTVFYKQARFTYSDIQIRLKAPGMKGSNVAKVQYFYPDSCSQFDGKCRSGKIGFRCEQDWQIYDQFGNMVKKGHSKTIDVSDLPKGGYFILYSNKMSEFFLD